MDNDTEITPLSAWRGQMRGFVGRLTYLPGSRSAERFTGDHRLLSALEDTLEVERASTGADLHPDVIRDAIEQTELTCRGWRVVGFEDDPVRALDKHFETEQRRFQAQQAEQQRIQAAQAENQIRLDAQTVRLNEAAARRTWGLPELDPEPPGGVAA
jgi:hypothetical protein